MKERLAENNTSIKYPNDKKTNRVAYRDTNVNNSYVMALTYSLIHYYKGRRNHTRLIIIIVIIDENVIFSSSYSPNTSKSIHSLQGYRSGKPLSKL